MCRKCADGYKLKDGKCQGEYRLYRLVYAACKTTLTFLAHLLKPKDLSSQQRDSYVNITRLLTYFGMCVATCVIFQSSTHIAYIVGGAVAIYIAASEYWLNWTAQGAQKPEIDTKQLEDLIMKSL